MLGILGILGWAARVEDAGDSGPGTARVGDAWWLVMCYHLLRICVDTLIYLWQS